MRVVVFQPPAWLWETPAHALAQALGVPHIHFGDLMRAQLRRRTELGIRFIQSMNSGELPADDLLTATVRDHLRQNAPAGFLIDPYTHPDLGGALGIPATSPRHAPCTKCCANSARPSTLWCSCTFPSTSWSAWSNAGAPVVSVVTTRRTPMSQQGTAVPPSTSLASKIDASPLGYRSTST
ncbi:nucleoside monophosphate kinase [Streptomyces sp. NPDC006733]|uniref:nucleoside monophosphate kinase n=1 Tax=Streptomyces sp. NPDC006733 TaxID=3155460 RepID=UPI0033C837FF